MLKITHGTPNEFQIWLFYGIIAFAMTAPVIIVAASIYGWLTRPRPDAEVAGHETSQNFHVESATHATGNMTEQPARTHVHFEKIETGAQPIPTAAA